MTANYEDEKRYFDEDGKFCLKSDIGKFDENSLSMITFDENETAYVEKLKEHFEKEIDRILLWFTENDEFIQTETALRLTLSDYYDKLGKLKRRGK